jgi:hypothetical protein
MNLSLLSEINSLKGEKCLLGNELGSVKFIHGYGHPGGSK